MGEQHRLVEARAVAGDPGLDRGAGQSGKDGFLRLVEGERHEGGARLGHAVPELLRDPVGEPGRAHLRDRLAPGGQHEVIGGDGHGPAGAGQPGTKGSAVMGDLIDGGFQPERGVAHLGAQQGDDVLGRPVAEQLPQRLFVPRDAMARDEVKEIPLRVAAEGGFAEMRVLRQERSRARCAGW